MRVDDEPRFLAVLLGLAATLHLVAWLAAGPPTRQGFLAPPPAGTSLADWAAPP